jgi:hypothetical protein
VALTWTKGSMSTGFSEKTVHEGRSGKIRLFTIHWDGLLSKYHQGGREKLTGWLPGFKDDLGHFETVEEAKARADAVFVKWLDAAKLKED